MNSNSNKNTLAKAYAGIIGIPLAALLLVSAIGSDTGGRRGHYIHDDLDRAINDAPVARSEADAYKSLGKYNPCIMIACDGE